jgi:uncharacterized membrane protein
VAGVAPDRPLAVLLIALTVAAVSIGGCGGGSESDASDSGAAPACSSDVEVGDLPCDVAAVLASRCHACHTDPPAGGAKWPLLTYEDAAEPLGMTGKRKWQRMAEVIEPQGLPHMPYQNAPQLTTEELDALRSWLGACAPPVAEGDGCDVGE